MFTWHDKCSVASRSRFCLSVPRDHFRAVARLMSGFLGDYEDSDEDDDAPSCLARAAQEAAAAESLKAAAISMSPPPAEVADTAVLEGVLSLVPSPPASSSSEEEAEEADESFIPPSPPGEPDPHILERVRSLHRLRSQGKSIRDQLGSRDWSNPYILERVIKVFGLEEYSSNYPKDVFDPARIAEHPSDFYDAPECERPPMPKRQRRGSRELG